MSKRRVMVGIVVATAATLLVSACGATPSAGAAATVGDRTIANDVLASQVDAVQQAKLGVSGQPDAALVADVLQRLVITDLVDVGAAKEGVVVTQGQVDQALSAAEQQLGGRGSLLKAFLDSNVPEGAIEDQIRLSVQVDELGKKLAPNGAAQDQQQAVFTYIVQLGKELGTQVSPRYGTWVDDQLQVGPTPTDLSLPQASPDPLAGIVPSG